MLHKLDYYDCCCIVQEICHVKVKNIIIFVITTCNFSLGVWTSGNHCSFCTSVDFLSVRRVGYSG